MADLGRQLRDWVDAEAPPIAIEDLATPPPSRPSRLSPARLAVALAGLALVLAAVAVTQRASEQPFLPVIGDREAVGLPASAPAPATLDVGVATRWRWELAGRLDAPPTFDFFDGGDRVLRLSDGDLLRSFDGQVWSEKLTDPPRIDPVHRLERGAAWQDVLVSSWSVGTTSSLRITTPAGDEVRVFQDRNLEFGVGPAGVLVVSGSEVSRYRHGVGWDQLASPAGGIGHLVGTASGFYAITDGEPGARQVVHSLDGERWDLLAVDDSGAAVGSLRDVLRWGDRALLLSDDSGSGGRLAVAELTPEGATPLFTVAADFAAVSDFDSVAAAGDLGIVLYERQTGRLLHSLAGEPPTEIPLAGGPSLPRLGWPFLAVTGQAIVVGFEYDEAGGGELWTYTPVPEELSTPGTARDAGETLPPTTSDDRSVYTPCLGDEGQTVEGIDLDGDGIEDRARLDVVDQMLVVCLGHGQTVQGSTDDEDWAGPRTSIEAVDLGGIPGIALVAHLDDPGFQGRDVRFVRWVDGGLGAVGPGAAQSDPPDFGGGEQYGEGVEQPWGPTAYGCRPPSNARTREGHEVDFEVAQIGTGGFRVDLVLGNNGTAQRLPERPEITRETDLHQLLRDLGFTPRCLPEE